MNVRITIFGDSDTYGAWDSLGGWCDRLKQALHQTTMQSQGANKFQVMNLGVGGDSSSEIAARLRPEMTARLSEKWQPVIILRVGTNDSRGVGSQEAIQVPLPEFKNNMHQILETAKGFTLNVLIVGLTPLGAPVVQLNDNYYVDQRIREYDQALSDLAASHAIEKIELYDLVSPWRRDILAWDGLHLNDAGHKLVFDHIRPLLSRFLQEAQ